MDKKWCLDTYALMEIARGNKNFFNYLDGDYVITDITLAEFYAVLLREHDERIADYWFSKLESNSISADKFILKKAIKFRYENRKTGISFFDAVGYIFSISSGYFFVTGDKEFEKFDNVEFVK